jgi:putative transposase
LCCIQRDHDPRAARRVPEARTNLAQHEMLGTRYEYGTSAVGTSEPGEIRLRCGMSHTYASTLVHCVFSTKQRVAFIDTDLQPRLWAYMGGIARTQGFTAIVIGGTENHAHALLQVPPPIALAEAVKKIKAASSKWVHDNYPERKDFAWQQGYGAFSVSLAQGEHGGVHTQLGGAPSKAGFSGRVHSLSQETRHRFDPAHVWG